MDVTEDISTANTREMYHGELREFYERFAPEKVDKIDQILDHWRGHYPQMMDTLSSKYVAASTPTMAHRRPRSSHHRPTPHRRPKSYPRYKDVTPLKRAKVAAGAEEVQNEQNERSLAQSAEQPGLVHVPVDATDDDLAGIMDTFDQQQEDAAAAGPAEQEAIDSPGDAVEAEAEDEQIQQNEATMVLDELATKLAGWVDLDSVFRSFDTVSRQQNETATTTTKFIDTPCAKVILWSNGMSMSFVVEWH